MWLLVYAQLFINCFSLEKHFINAANYALNDSKDFIIPPTRIWWSLQRPTLLQLQSQSEKMVNIEFEIHTYFCKTRGNSLDQLRKTSTLISTLIC